MKFNRTQLILIAFLASLVGGCQSDTITSTWVPKEDSAKVPVSAVRSAEDRGIKWTLPTGWTEQTAQDMRVGSFLSKGPNGQNVDISVVPLSGSAGGMVANINRWRGQIQLPPIEEKDLEAEAKLMTVGKRQMNYVDIVSAEPLIDNKLKKRIVAAIYQNDGQTWFFKMSGEDEAVRAVKPQFREFLSSLQFNE